MRNTVRINATFPRLLVFLSTWAVARLFNFLSMPERILNVDTTSLAGSKGRNDASMFFAFLIGSVMFSFIDHKMGTDPPIDLRVIYMITGAFLMLAAVLGWRLIVAGG